MKSIASIFPLASQSFIDANPLSSPSEANKSDSSAIVGALRAIVKKRSVLNKTEAEFALILEAQKLNGEIARYEPFGITLRWLSGDTFIRYTPDFIVTQYDAQANLSIKLIEVKGPFIKGKFERAVERFRHARTYWPEFSFELWQKQKTGWKRLQ